MKIERCEDLRPAFSFSQAVQSSTTVEVEKYLNDRNNYPIDTKFDKVHVSVDRKDDSRSVKFLVAYGKDVTFIAFRGARALEDLGNDRKKPLTSLDLLAKVEELAASFVGPDSELLLAELHRSTKRIIFCGHSLGGAVAQMVVYNFWKSKSTDSIKSEKSPDSFIAISFGAPQIWESRIVKEVNDNPLFKDRFLNVSNDEDPLRKPGDFLVDGLQVPQPESSPTFGIQVSAKCFEPGIWSRFVSVKPWSKLEFNKWYKLVVEDVLAKTNFSGHKASADQTLSKILVLSPTPQVTSASRKASDSGCFITIEGSNLLFLRERVKLDGLDAWDTKMQTDGCLKIFSSDKPKPKDRKKPVSQVVITTAFGGVSHDVSEANEEPLRCLSTIVQVYNMWATPGPFSSIQSKQDVETVFAALDDVIQWVPDTKDGERPFTRLFERRANGSSNVEEMNALVQKVTTFLNTSYEIHYKMSVFREVLVALGTLVLTALMEDPLIATALRALIVGPLIAMGHYFLIREMMGTILSPQTFLVENYSKMLEVAIREALLWNGLDPNSPTKPLAQQSVTQLESTLQEEVHAKGSKFSGSLARGYGLNADLENLFQSKGSCLTLAKPESKQNFLRRMHIVAQTVDLFNRKLKDTVFLGLVGEEDAGKSTFIKNVIKRVGSAGAKRIDAPQVGMDYHTDTVTPYKLHDQLYLVDFPGSNGVEKYADAWVQFTALPSSCILLLHFKGDIKQEQVETYNKMQEGLKSKIAVVFNKVDELYTLRNAKVYDAMYFENHRKKSAEKLGCDLKNLHYACLDPEFEERLTALRKVGVLGAEELASKLEECFGIKSGALGTAPKTS